MLLYNENVSQLCHLSVQFENFLCFQILDAHNASLIYHMSWKEFLSLNTKIANFRYTQSYLNKNQWFDAYFYCLFVPLLAIDLIYGFSRILNKSSTSPLLFCPVPTDLRKKIKMPADC